MANKNSAKKSAKKAAKQSKVRRLRNLSRASDVKTACRKVLDALKNKEIDSAKDLFKQAESKISRARGKGLLKKNTASRKISRLAKKVATVVKGEEK